jgi:hypothetical protein
MHFGEVDHHVHIIVFFKRIFTMKQTRQMGAVPYKFMSYALMPLICMIGTTEAVSASALQLQLPVSYHPQVKIDALLKQSCQVTDMMAMRLEVVVQDFNRNTLNKRAVQPVGTGSDMLRVEIIDVSTQAQEKSITAHAQLLAQGKVVHETQLTGKGAGGLFSNSKNDCTILERSAKSLSSQLSTWIKSYE